MINANYYVYEWYIVETGEVFYVGKGSGNRATSMKDRNDLFKQIRREHKCDYRILRYFTDNKEAFAYEKERGLELKAIGQARACFMLGAEDRYTDDSVFDKMSRTWFEKGFEPWNKGKQMDEAYRERCRKAKLGTSQSEETKRKRSAALMNHPVSEDVRKRIAAARRKPIIVHDIIDGTYTKYQSIQDFAAVCGVTQSAITRVLNSEKPYRKRYIIKHADPEGV
jgi:hypothetical protein